MAGAYLTIGAKYRPFSYEELIRPVAMATEMHNKIDEQYADLQSKAGVWENLANRETDPESYKKYKDYSDSLKAQAEDLAKNGLNPQSMRDMLNLRARYSSDIVPLEQAYTRRRQLADEQRKMIMQNPTLKFERDMNTTSLDDFVKNPELDYGYSVNGAMIAKQAGEAFSHLAKSIQEEPQYKHILNNNYYQSMLKSGYSPEQILALARNDNSAPAELRQISQQIYDSTGVEDFIKNTYPNAGTNENEALQAQEWRDYVNSYINQGAWSAVGTTSYGTVADPDAAFRRQIALAQARSKQKSSKPSAAAGTMRRNDAALYGTKGKGQGNREIYMGTADVKSSEDSKFWLNKIARVYSGDKYLEYMDGFDKDGEMKFSKRKYKKFDEKNTTVLGAQIDYSTGDIYVSVKEDGSREIERIRLPRDKGTYSLQTEQDLDEIARQNMQIDLDVAAGRLTEEEAASYREYLKNVMFDALNSLFDYTGTLNVNTDAGEKRSMNTSVYDVPDFDE